MSGVDINKDYTGLYDGPDLTAPFAEEAANEVPEMATVSVYMDDGRVFSYYVFDPMKGREHAYAIIQSGYRHTPEGSSDLEWYPPHRIVKIKVTGGGEGSNYRDIVRAT